jgi:outer membrane receptor for ferrienterochelin and colicin
VGLATGIAEMTLLLPAASYAQGAAAEGSLLEEVVVTAQRREEKAVDVPITIAAIDVQQLATANVQDLSDIRQLTPSLRFTTLPTCAIARRFNTPHSVPVRSGMHQRPGASKSVKNCEEIHERWNLKQVRAWVRLA